MFNITGGNPFVRGALAILVDHEGNLSEELLSTKLAKYEPMLSPLNLRCAAREALRLWAREVEQQAQAEEARKAAEEAAGEAQEEALIAA